MHKTRLNVYMYVSHFFSRSWQVTGKKPPIDNTDFFFTLLNFDFAKFWDFGAVGLLPLLLKLF